MRQIEGELLAKLENLENISRHLATEERDYEARKQDYDEANKILMD